MKKKSALLTGLTLSLMGVFAQSPVHAEGWYSSFSGGVSKTDLGSKASFDEVFLGNQPGRSSLDDSGEAWAVHVGYRFNSYVAAEVGYVELGKFRYEAEFDNFAEEDTFRVRSNGLLIAALGILPLGKRFDLYARGGVYLSDTRVRLQAVDLTDGSVIGSAEVRASDKDLLAGVGAAWNISQDYALRVEVQRFFDVGDDDHTGENDIDLLTFGVVFR